MTDQPTTIVSFCLQILVTYDMNGKYLAVTEMKDAPALGNFGCLSPDTFDHSFKDGAANMSGEQVYI